MAPSGLFLLLANAFAAFLWLWFAAVQWNICHVKRNLIHKCAQTIQILLDVLKTCLEKGTICNAYVFYFNSASLKKLCTRGRPESIRVMVQGKLVVGIVQQSPQNKLNHDVNMARNQNTNAFFLQLFVTVEV